MRTKQQIFTAAAALVVAFAMGGMAVADCGANPAVIATTGPDGASQIFTAGFQADPSFAYSSYYGAITSCGAYNGCTPISVALTASFWRFGAGDPTVGLGSDSGSFDLVANGGVTFGAFPSYGYYSGARLNTGWQPGTDGCIDGNNCLCMLLTDTDGDNTYYAALSAQSDATLVTTLEQGGTDGSGIFNSPIIMAAVAKPSINGSVRSAPFDGTTDLAVSVSPGAGVYNKDACDCSPTGYRILQQIVPRGNMPPTTRDLGAWTEAVLDTGAQPAGGTPLGTPATVRVTCDASPTGADDVYLTTQLIFDSGFATPLVSANSSRVECGTNLADPNDKPRQRPGNVKPIASPRGRGGK